MASTKNVYKLFVGNIPWTVGTRELRLYFSEFGRVLQANVVFDKNTGLSQGYGFVSLNKEGLENVESKQQHILEGYTLHLDKNN
ncbi:SRA stem-loop-interacting RNA-binding protein, mitochondrial [Phlebotomus argentipes]|uniref:SRA stem-loop-interacting RNA-binding protein, mitochondrial n=1 Tax=Phlebotomus argentipes TaxID=94469 RepID=UPI002892E85F|nr:SRA stem-loop-interacting RNA-binding protein, mitochondrial [Phlebotomus argentipes]